ncbi:AMP-binding protein [Streptomyces sp. NPDC058398]|uniref:non-ribosomal peptide synthetase n=1 Tax=Streptomyces sp. NPDC058398 TaxID=3346479 RepID=UPI00364A07EA
MLSSNTSRHLARSIADSLERSPEATAVLGDQHLTNRQLDLMSRACVSALNENGVGPGDVVALDSALDSRFVAALLAVVRTGAAYVGLDFADTGQATTVADSVQPTAWVTRPGRPVPAGAATVLLDDTVEPPDPARATEPANAVTAPDDAFQVVFTSGSLGARKAVVTTYQGVLNRVLWFLDAYPLRPGSVVAVHKDVSLVGSPVEMLTGLLAGAPLLFLDKHTVLDPEAFWSALAEHRVTHLFGSPPLLQLLLDGAAEPDATTLDVVTSSAQSLSASLAGRWTKKLPGTRLLNMYGLTEAASNVTCFDVTGTATAQDDGSVPVGTPITGCDVRVLGPDGQPVPDGTTGEVHVGGVCLARGYLDRPEETAERFVSDPDGARLFRTGDLGRWTEHGLEILGRTDTQIKVRGFKVLPEVVEAVLAGLPGVWLAAVIPVGDPLDAQDIVAFVEGAGPLDVDDLARQSSPRLPTHARPGRIVQVAELPRTVSGKPDRARLAELLDTDRPAAAPAADGLTATEELVRGIWLRVLEKDTADRADDFFQTLGGHSLKATNVIAVLRRETGVKVPLRLIFDHPVLADFAAALDAFTAARESGARG